MKRKYDKKPFTPTTPGKSELILDWRNLTATRKRNTTITKNFISSVKDQTAKGRCAASYAFAATALLEFDFIDSNYNSSLETFSEQQIIDCTGAGT